MKRFINLEELKLEKDEMNAIEGGKCSWRRKKRRKKQRKPPKPPVDIQPLYGIIALRYAVAMRYAVIAEKAD